MSLEEAAEKLQEVEQYEIRQADVVVATCSCSGDSRLHKVPFDAVVLDESSQSVEPEQMIAISHTFKHVVLIGDNEQLGPSISLQQLR